MLLSLWQFVDTLRIRRATIVVGVKQVDEKARVLALPLGMNPKKYAIGCLTIFLRSAQCDFYYDSLRYFEIPVSLLHRGDL